MLLLFYVFSDDKCWFIFRYCKQNRLLTQTCLLGSDIFVRWSSIGAYCVHSIWFHNWNFANIAFSLITNSIILWRYKFTCVVAAALVWQMQNFGLIWSSYVMWELKEYYKVGSICPKALCEMIPLCQQLSGYVKRSWKLTCDWCQLWWWDQIVKAGLEMETKHLSLMPWGWQGMADILWITFWNTFVSKKSLVNWLKSYGSLWLGIEFLIIHHWFKWQHFPKTSPSIELIPPPPPTHPSTPHPTPPHPHPPPLPKTHTHINQLNVL